MPLDQAVLDWQVVAARRPGGERRIEVVAVAARREMLGRPDRGARARRPAPGRHRPLGVRADPRPRRGADPAARAAADPLAAEPRRVRAGNGRSTATSATSPTSRSRAAPIACSAASLGFGIEGIAQSLAATQRAQTRARPPVADPRRARDDPVEEIEGDPEMVEYTREALTEGAPSSSTSCGARSSTTRARRARSAVDEVVVCRRRDHDPRPGRAAPARARPCRWSRRRPAALRTSPARPGRAADGLLRPRAGGVGDAPRQPDSTRGPPRRPVLRCAPASPPTRSSACSPSPWSASSW